MRFSQLAVHTNAEWVMSNNLKVAGEGRVGNQEREGYTKRQAPGSDDTQGSCIQNLFIVTYNGLCPQPIVLVHLKV